MTPKTSQPATASLRQRPKRGGTDPHAELVALRARLDETEETLRAIRSGEVDALVITTRIGEQIFTLRSAERPYRVFIENMSEGAVTLAGDGTILYSNTCFAEMLATALDRVAGAAFGDFVTAGHQPTFAALLARGTHDRCTGEVELAAADGGSVSVQVSLHPLETDELRGICAVVTDITVRKRAEEALQRSAIELARSNEELQQFAYVVSHDLQEPLRMVASYVELLANRYRGRLDADADDFIAFAVDGAIRMQQLLNDLLKYSRVGSRAKEFAPTACDTVLAHVLDNLRVAIETAQAAVTHDALPTLMADDVQLSQVLQNLIGNAIKFHGEAPPRVHVSAERQDGSWRFAVRDNGIGIDARHFERIFVIFERLHSRGAYPGTGIGLAISKRIVERHGGRIWVESAPGEGSTFFFTIPDRAAAPPTDHVRPFDVA